jgi:uncharacterized protein (DUF885 family)
MKHSILALLVSSLLVGATLLSPSASLADSTTLAPTPAQPSKMAQIAEEYFEEKIQLDPLEGSDTTAEERFEDKLEITIAPANIKKHKQLVERTLHQLKKLDTTTLDHQDRISYRMLRQQLEMQQQDDKFPGQLAPINQLRNFPVEIAQYGSGQDIQPLKTPANYDHYLARLNKLPEWIDQAISNMQVGIKRGIVQPQALINSTLPSLRALTNPDIERNPYYTAINQMPPEFSAQERARITAAYKKTIAERLIPAATKLVSFLENQYLPHARTSAGMGALPKGNDWYKLLVKHHTTTNMTPDEIHNLGLQEVARIQAEMENIKAHYQFTGSLLEFLQWHNNNRQFQPFTSEQQILDSYAQLNEKIMGKLPALFGRMPKAPLVIRPEPELTRNTASDHYNTPAADGSRPGTFYAVINDPSAYRNSSMTSLFLHEGQPGHHFHIALQQELDLPKFRKYGWITAYGEGWALYAETLGKEMGLYQDPNQYLGHLKLELMRAVRLVTDTGLHAKGWSREQTIKYMMDTEGKSEADAIRATERYMAIPGQALAYKIGALKIQALRQKAQTQLGEKFSLSAFHDLVLSDGVLPLTLLEENVNDWIASELKASANGSIKTR